MEASPLDGEIVGRAQDAQPVLVYRLPVSLVRRRQAAGKCRELRLLPARPLILDRPHALGDALLLVRRLDGLAGERIVGARLDGPVQDDMGAQEEIMVGRAAGESVAAIANSKSSWSVQ